MPTKGPIENGDVFETKLPDGRFGAIRIIKYADKMCLIAVTPYISKNPAEISNPLLKSILVKNFCNWNQDHSVLGYSNPKLRTLRYVGNLPLTQQEEKMKLWFGPGGYPYGSWGKWVGWEVYRQWLWDHDREVFEAEIEQQSEELEKDRDVQPKPGKTLDDQTFWTLIDRLDWTKAGRDEQVIEPLVSAVASLKKTELFRFEETLSYKLFLLDTRKHAEHAFPSEKNLSSVDQFLYLRCVVVANGRKFYEKVLKKPSMIPKDLEFEALLSVTSKAFLRKAGSQEFDFVPSCSYETYSNRDGWR